MGSFHVPWLAGSRRAGPRMGRMGRAALAVAVLAGLTLVSGMHSVALGATEGPYGGTPAAVPGTVLAANYDTGGQGVGYNVTSVNGTANSYRSDGVDLEACTDTGCGYDIGWTTAGQWFNYTVDVATAGTYTVGFRVASPYGETDGLHIDNSAGTNLTGAVDIPDTGGYQDWTTVDASVTLPAGVQTLTVDQDDNGWNYWYMDFTSTGTGGDQPFGGTPAAVPGTAYAANYDTGGQGVAYNVTSTNGTANSYRSDGVDLEDTSDTSPTSAAGDGYDLGWTSDRAMVQLHGGRGLGGYLCREPAPGRAQRGDRRAAHRQLRRGQPHRRRHRARDRRLPGLDDGDGERHAAGWRADPDR